MNRSTLEICIVLVLGLGAILSVNVPPMPNQGGGGFDPTCKDKLDNCKLFPHEDCIGQYEDWAKDNCNKTCGYCKGIPDPCVDKLSNCADYGTDACTSPDFHAWAYDNCRLSCQLCEGVTFTSTVPTTIAPADCKDKVDCRLYGADICTKADYGPWVKDNCMLFCNVCIGLPTQPKPCADKVPCDRYDKDMCTNPQYKIWVEDNCPAHCGKCNGGVTSKPTPAMPTPPPLTTRKVFLTPPPMGGGGLLTPPPPGRK